MYGILGFNWSDSKLCKLMISTLIHRGPNDEGFYFDTQVSKRLSINRYKRRRLAYEK